MVGRPPKYTERHRFMVEVLYLHGLSSSRIAASMRLYSVPMSDRAVQKIIAGLAYRKTEMPGAVRQRFLDRLKARRLDRAHGMTGLPDEFYLARES
jgi:hypothetical protein